MKIFVIHYTKLEQRKAHIIAQFERHNITDYDFIETYNQEDLTPADVNLFTPDIRRSVMSLTHKHLTAYRMLIQGDYEGALVLEDDVILADDFVRRFEAYMTEVPKGYDMVFIGNGCNLHIHPRLLVPNKHIYLKDIYPNSVEGNGGTRCTDSYVVSKAGAMKICTYVDGLTTPIGLTTDWWLNEVIRACKMTIYWAEPTIITQGSEVGKYASSTS